MRTLTLWTSLILFFPVTHTAWAGWRCAKTVGNASLDLLHSYIEALEENAWDFGSTAEALGLSEEALARTLPNLLGQRGGWENGTDSARYPHYYRLDLMQLRRMIHLLESHCPNASSKLLAGLKKAHAARKSALATSLLSFSPEKLTETTFYGEFEELTDDDWDAIDTLIAEERR